MDNHENEPDKKFTKTYEVLNGWRVVITEGYINSSGNIYNVDVEIYRLNGDRWETEITGSLKANGCCDWGQGFEVLMHFCEREESTILLLAYDKAHEFMKEWNEAHNGEETEY